MEKKILNHYAYLSKQLTNFENIFILLIQNEIISQDEADNLRLPKTDLARSSELWNLLNKKDWHRIESCVIEILQNTNNGHCADVLMGKDIEKINGAVNLLPQKWWSEKYEVVTSYHDREIDGKPLVCRLFDILRAQNLEIGIIRQRLVICGLGGIGKTTTAKSFAHFYEDQYDHVIWINCHAHNLHQSFQNLARDLKIDDFHSDLKYLAKKCSEKLSTRRCLFIFDNASRLFGENGIEDALPDKNVNYEVLITSRFTEWGNQKGKGCISTYLLTAFSLQDSLEFLSTHLNTMENTNKPLLEELAFCVAHLPLALQIAVVSINNTKLSVQKYINIVTNAEDKFLGYRFDDYPHSIFETMQISLDEIQKDKDNGKLAFEILILLAYLDSDEVPVKFLEAILNLEDWRIAFAINTIKTHSLVTHILEEELNSTISIHKLLQQVIRETSKNDISQILQKILKTNGFLGYKRTPFGFIEQLQSAARIHFKDDFQVLALCLEGNENPEDTLMQKQNNNIDDITWLIEYKLMISIFKMFPLQWTATTTVDEILEQLKASLGKHSGILNADIERVKITEAFNAIKIYTEGMEASFLESFVFAKDDIEKLHNRYFSASLDLMKNTNFLQTTIKGKLMEAKNLFETSNQGLEKRQLLITAAVEEMKKFYKEDATSQKERQLLRKTYCKIRKIIVMAAKDSCLVNKSSWANYWLENFHGKLKTEFDGVKEIQEGEHQSEFQQRKKMEEDKLDIQLEEIRKKREGELLAKIDEMKDALERELKAEAAKEKAFQDLKLRNQFAEVKKAREKEWQHELGKMEDERKKDSSKFEKLFNKILKEEATKHVEAEEMKVPTQSDALFNRYIGINLDFEAISVTLFSDSGTTEILRKENATIAYDGGVIFLKEGQSTLKDYLAQQTNSSSINLEAIFGYRVGNSIRLNWDGAKTFRTEELLSMFLFCIKRGSEKILEGPINTCAISVPSYFHQIEAKAVFDGARIAGFETVKIFRQMSAGAIGTVSLKYELPKEFILVDVSTDIWDGGYYNLNRCLFPIVISGDIYVNPTYRPGNMTLDKRFGNIVNDIISQCSQTANIFVVIIGDEKAFSEVTRSNSTVQDNLSFQKIDNNSVKDGISLIASLMTRTPKAVQLLKDSISLNSEEEVYDLGKYLDYPWTAPSFSQNPVHKVSGSNLNDLQLTEVKEKMGIYFKIEDQGMAFEEAKNYLQTVSKFIHEKSFDSEMGPEITKLIEKTLEAIINDQTPKNIRMAIGNVRQNYEKGLPKQ